MHTGMSCVAVYSVIYRPAYMQLMLCASSLYCVMLAHILINLTCYNVTYFTLPECKGCVQIAVKLGDKQT